MSLEQLRRPSGHQEVSGEQGAVRYGVVFPAVEKPVAPQDAATMQSAENLVFGQMLRGGPAVATQSSATAKERRGAVRHNQAMDATAVQGVTVSETRVPGGRIITEFVASQAVGRYLTWDDDGGARAGGGGASTGARGAALCWSGGYLCHHSN